MNEDLRPYFAEGRVIGKASLFSLLTAEGVDASGPPSERDTLIQKRWNPDFSARMVGKRLDEYIEDDPHTWTIDDEPHQASAGVLLFATDIDLETGTLEGSYWDSLIRNNDALFWDNEELFVSQFSDADYDVHLGGLTLELDRIELLHPMGDFVATSDTPMRTPNRIGRPPRWDWDGAMAAIVAAAQHPDGLPIGPGAQAMLERRIADWFTAQTGDAPAPSQIRQRASRVMATLKSPESP